MYPDPLLTAVLPAKSPIIPQIMSSSTCPLGTPFFLLRKKRKTKLSASSRPWLSPWWGVIAGRGHARLFRDSPLVLSRLAEAAESEASLFCAAIFCVSRGHISTNVIRLSEQREFVLHLVMNGFCHLRSKVLSTNWVYRVSSFPMTSSLWRSFSKLDQTIFPPLESCCRPDDLQKA